MIDEAHINSDEGGFELVLTGDFAEAVQRYLDDPDADRLVLRLPQDAAIQLHAQAVAALGPWVAEYEFYKGTYARASSAERAEVHGIEPDDDCGYELTDPKHPDYRETVAAGADLARDRVDR